MKLLNIAGMSKALINSISNQLDKVKIDTEKEVQTSSDQRDFSVTKLKVYLIARPYFGTYPSYRVRRTEIDEKRFLIKVNLEWWGDGRFRTNQTDIFLNLKGGNTTIVFLGEIEMILISLSCEKRKHLGHWLKMMEFWERKFSEIRNKYKRRSRTGKIIFIGLVPLGPEYETYHAVADRMNEVLMGMARRNPKFIGFRGFPENYFEPREKFFVKNQEFLWKTRGKVKLIKFLGEVIDTMAENCQNTLPLNEWPLFKLPD